MSRVKIKFPSHNPLLVVEVPVRISDINYGGHVGNDSILSIIHEARLQLLTKWGFTELNIDGVGIIMADVSIAYKSEGFYGDIFNVHIYANEITSYGFDLLYHIKKDENGNNVDIAHAKTGIVCFDYDKRRITELPNTLKTKLSVVKN